MFELNEAIERWRRDMKTGGVRRRDTLDELESHLHEDLDHLTGEGLGEEEAFRQAAQRLGESERLGTEFRKARGVKGRLLELVGGGFLEEDPDGGYRFTPKLIATLFCAYLAFIVFGWGCAIGSKTTILAWVGRGALLMLKISLGLALMASVPWGIAALYRRLWNKERTAKKDGVIPLMVFTGVVLLPFFFCAVLQVGFIVPSWIVDWRTPEAKKIVRSAGSPDGQWQAYVLKIPTFDEDTQILYLRRTGEKKSHRVARMVVERAINNNQSIQWSPWGDVVVYVNGFDLVALRPADMASAVIPLGGIKDVKPDGSFSLDYRLLEVGEVGFPRPGVVTYRLKSRNGGAGGEVKTIPPEAYRIRPESSYLLPDRAMLNEMQAVARANQSSPREVK